jgi:hypothetical protein
MGAKSLKIGDAIHFQRSLWIPKSSTAALIQQHSQDERLSRYAELTLYPTIWSSRKHESELMASARFSDALASSQVREMFPFFRRRPVPEGGKWTVLWIAVLRPMPRYLRRDHRPILDGASDFVALRSRGLFGRPACL